MNGKNVVAVITCDHVNELHAEPFWCTGGQATDLFTDIIGVTKIASFNCSHLSSHLMRTALAVLVAPDTSWTVVVGSIIHRTVNHCSISGTPSSSDQTDGQSNIPSMPSSPSAPAFVRACASMHAWHIVE